MENNPQKEQAGILRYPPEISVAIRKIKISGMEENAVNRM